MKKLLMFLLLGMFLISFASATANLYEKYTGPSNNGRGTLNAGWTAQTFTVGNTSENVGQNITLVSFYQSGTPTTKITIRVTDVYANQTPTNLDTPYAIGEFSGTLNDGWNNITMASPQLLSPSEEYAIIMNVSTSSVNWLHRETTANYTGGTGVYSENSGGLWIVWDRDQLFMVWGEESAGNIGITLLDPADQEILTDTEVSFAANITMGTELLTISNVSLLINGMINQTNTSTTEGLYNFSQTFPLSSYNWSIQVYDNESTLYESETRDFTIGSSITSITYNTHTYETVRETFSAEFDIVEGAEISNIILVYNGTNYPISNITIGSTNLTVSRTIDIPINTNPLTNETKGFFFRFTYGGGNVQETATYEQNISLVNLQICDATYTITSLNFTLRDEKTLININASTNPVTFEAYFSYWLGGGSVTKNYTYQVINSTLGNNFTFCIYPYLPDNYTFKTNLDNIYSAIDYSENNYYLRNATLTNQTGDFSLLLFLLDETSSTKFYVTFKQGITFIEDALVTISKFFIGTGDYKTVGIKLTDDNGQFPFYADIDGQYRWTVVKEGQTLGIIEKTATCASSPCELEINLDEATANIFEGYSEYYASNVQSTLVYDQDTKIVTYTFVDTTGLAQYFRLKVSKISYNQTTGKIICDSQSFSVAGTLTCNVTGYEGNFFATGYISRSPEVIDKIIDFVIADAFNELGLMGLLLNVIIIITMVFASATISRGNPSTVVFVLGVTILLLKLGGLFPFSWIVVVSIEALIAYIMTKLKV